MRMLQTLLLFVAVNVSLTGNMNAAEVKSKDGYSFTVPSGWKAIPRKVIDQYLASMRKMSPNFKNLNYSYAYQRSGSQGWFVYPYFVIQVSRTGKIPEKYLQNFSRVEQDIQKGVNKAEKGMKGKARGKVKNTVYDKKNGIVWTGIDANVAGVGKIRGLSAMKLTNYGFIQFVFTATDKNYSKYEKDFRRMVWKMDVDKKYQY